MNANILIGLLLLGSAGLFLYFDKKLLISNKIQAKFKINHFLGLYLFILITMVLGTLIVGMLAVLLHLPSIFTYVIQTILMGGLLGLFSNIQKIFRRKKRI